MFHMDANLNNCKFNNLKTVCANCQTTLHLEESVDSDDLVPVLSAFIVESFSNTLSNLAFAHCHSICRTSLGFCPMSTITS